MMDQVLAQTKTKSFEIFDKGDFNLVESFYSDALMILDIDIYNVDNQTGNIVLKITDNTDLFFLAYVNTMKNPIYNYKSNGMVKYWNGAGLNLMKDYAGRILITVQYIQLPGVNYSTWKR